MPLQDSKLGRSDYVYIDGGDSNFLRNFSSLIADEINATGAPIRYSDSPSVDAFARLRVSNPTGLFDSQSQYDESPILWQSKITNNSGSAAVAHLPNESSVQLTVGANDSVIRQTRQYIRYQPGKSQLVLMTFVPTTGVTGLTQRYGYFDDQNGIFLEIGDDDIPYIVRRSYVSGGPVDERVPQSEWNADRLDGAGISGRNVSLDRAQILIIDLEWLGVGRVRVGFVMDGTIYYAHSFNNSNVLTNVYMSTANLPIRYELVGGATLAAPTSVKQICSQVSSEGGIEYERGLLFSASNGVTPIAVTARRPVLSIRPRATFNSIVNRILVLAESIVAYSSTVTIYVELVYGGTLTNASFNNASTNFSGMEYDVAATAISGGITIFSDFVAATGVGTNRQVGRSLSGITARYPLALDIDGAHPTTPLTDNLSVVVTSLTGASTDVTTALNWREVR